MESGHWKGFAPIDGMAGIQGGEEVSTKGALSVVRILPGAERWREAGLPGSLGSLG